MQLSALLHGNVCEPVWSVMYWLAELVKQKDNINALSTLMQITAKRKLFPQCLGLSSTRKRNLNHQKQIFTNAFQIVDSQKP